jgi:hypothetical protein
MGNFLGISSTWPYAIGFGDQGITSNWDDTWVFGQWVGDANTNGDQLDGMYVQIGWDTEGWWDLGFAADKIAVFSSQDHGPYLGEGLEYRVYGANTLWDSNDLSPQATLTDIYLDGWRQHNPNEELYWLNGWCSDDISAMLQLNAAYRYIKLVSWDPYGSPTGYDEPEIDAVAALQEIPVYVDIKPGSWPNPINLAKRGVFSVAICGTTDLDVTAINATTIKLTLPGLDDGVSPIRWNYEDVATPWTGELGGGHALGGDGYLDLTLKFSTQEVGTALGLDAFLNQKIPLVITGNLNDADGGTPFVGQDYVWILRLNGDANDDLTVNIADAAGLSAHWYPGPPIGPLGYDAALDLNGDGTINVIDAAEVSANWGQTGQL